MLPFFSPLEPFSVRTISGTALQERAHTIVSKDEMMHTLFANFSLETLLESRVGISVIAQKTVADAENITLDRLCSGKVAAKEASILRSDVFFKNSADHCTWFGTCTFTGRYLSSQCIGGCRVEL